MLVAIWRLRPLAVPVWSVPCAGCGSPFLESTGCFRVNANGRLHDVWLIHRCPGCDARRKRAIHCRVRPDALGAALEAYRMDDASLAEAGAFPFPADRPLPCEVERPPLPGAGSLLGTIVQPRFCGARWDRLLAGELGWTRSRVRAGWAGGWNRTEPEALPQQAVRDGQRLHLGLRPGPGAGPSGRVLGQAARPADAERATRPACPRLRRPQEVLPCRSGRRSRPSSSSTARRPWCTRRAGSSPR